jgi:ferric-chelate reductase
MIAAAASKIQQGVTTNRLGRILEYSQFSPIRHSNLMKLPPLGIVLLLLIYLAFVLALEFVKQDILGDQHRKAIGVRAGWLTISQLPLLILLSGKVNIIGLITGVGYERLNIIHRWVARMMLLTATLHMGYQQALWNSLGLLQLEWNTDTCPPTGMSHFPFPSITSKSQVQALTLNDKQESRRTPSSSG